MTGTLVFLGGAAAGGAAGAVLGWLAGRRGAPRAEIPPAPPLKVPGIDLPIEPTLDTVLRLLVDQAAARSDLPCAVALREGEDAPMKIRATSATADPRFVGLEVDVGSLAARVVAERTPIVEPAVQSAVGASPGDRRRRPTGAVGVPVAAGAYVFGVLIAFGDPPLGGPETVARLDALAKAFAPYLLPALQAEVARRKAETDPVTDMPNRRGFDRALPRIGKGPAALIMVDIDHFKKVNDTHGHAAGDAALRHVGKLLRGALREGDVAARVGGEEFAVLLPGGDLRLGAQVAERLRAVVEKRPVLASGGEIKLTVSCGVTAVPYPVTHMDNLFPTADAALYRAKNSGRNCVAVSEEMALPKTGVVPAQGPRDPAAGPGAEAGPPA